MWSPAKTLLDLGTNGWEIWLLCGGLPWAPAPQAWGAFLEEVPEVLERVGLYWRTKAELSMCQGEMIYRYGCF